MEAQAGVVAVDPSIETTEYIGSLVSPSSTM